MVFGSIDKLLVMSTLSASEDWASEAWDKGREGGGKVSSFGAKSVRGTGVGRWDDGVREGETGAVGVRFGDKIL
jgi:hypothetical protein